MEIQRISHVSINPFHIGQQVVAGIDWMLKTAVSLWFGDTSKATENDSPRDVANDRIKQIQWLLYQGYIKRRRMRRARNEQEQCQRFVLWSMRYSGKFRTLINLYPEWLEQFADPKHNRTKLMRTIAFHLYQ